MKVQEDADLRSSVSERLPQKAVSSSIDFSNGNFLLHTIH